MPRLAYIMYSALKSGAMSAVQTGELCRSGLAGSHDLAILRRDGQMLTQRECPRLALLHSACQLGARVISVDLVLPSTQSFTADFRRAELAGVEGIFNGDQIPCLDAGDRAAAFVTAFAGEPCRLLIRDYARDRQTKWTHAEVKSSIACQDGWPFTIVSVESLRAVATAAGLKDVELLALIKRIRPTLVVDGIDAFEEDTWKRIRIKTVRGDWITLVVIKRRGRCELPNVNPTTGAVDWVQSSRLVKVLVERMERLLPEYPGNLGSHRIAALAIALGLQDPQARGTVALGAGIEVLDHW